MSKCIEASNIDLISSRELAKRWGWRGTLKKFEDEYFLSGKMKSLKMDGRIMTTEAEVLKYLSKQLNF